jgi:hypothetical protein
VEGGWQVDVDGWFHGDFFLGLFFDLEDRSDNFFETSVEIQRTTLCYIPERSVLQVDNLSLQLEV